jgi:hypothetical protein
VLITSVSLTSSATADGTPSNEVTANLVLTAFETASTKGTKLTTK